VHIVFREPRASRVAKWLKKKRRFKQKYQEIGPLNNGGQGARSSSPSSCSRSSLIVLLVIRDLLLYLSPISKDKLIPNPAKTFLSDRNLTLWDSSCKDMTGIKGPVSYCIHLLYPSIVSIL
jgi:hypothetical protein